MAIIDVNTKLVGLLGNPLGHSFSPDMHNKAFQTLGLNFFYLPIEVTPADLKEVALGIVKMNFGGYNVTIPHKISIMEHLDHIHELAAVIGAVNVVTIKDGRTTGYNTDGEGFVRSLEAEAGISVNGKRHLIVGCGGAARAIAMTMAFNGAKKILLSNRTEQKAHDLAGEINDRVRPCCDVVGKEPAEMKSAFEQADVVINATSVGMHPDENRLPLDTGLLRESQVVSDIVYNPVKTELLKRAEEKGCKIVTGLGMLVYQGVEGFKLWTGVAPPVDEMFAVVRAIKGC